jgi:predicted secreted protein
MVISLVVEIMFLPLSLYVCVWYVRLREVRLKVVCRQFQDSGGAFFVKKSYMCIVHDKDNTWSISLLSPKKC